MGTLHSDIMLGLFKDFGKKATDLNKKEFAEDKWSKKATVKSSSGNVKFEGSVTCAGKTESKLDFKDAQMEIKNKIDNNAVYTVEATAFKVMDGLDAKLIFATPAGAGEKACSNDAFFSSVSLGSEYATADINSSSALKINFDTAGKDAGAFSVTGCQFGSSNAYEVQDDLVIGFKFDKAQMKDSKFEIGEIKFGSTYTCGDMLSMARSRVTASRLEHFQPAFSSRSTRIPQSLRSPPTALTTPSNPRLVLHKRSQTLQLSRLGFHLLHLLLPWMLPGSRSLVASLHSLLQNPSLVLPPSR